MLVDVAVPLPVDRTFTYRVPAGLEEKAVPGRRVIVPFGPRAEIRGFIVRRAEDAEIPGLKEIASVLDDGPVLGADILELCRFISVYYGCSLGEALDAALPSGVKHGRAPKKRPHAELAVPVEEALRIAGETPERFAARARVLRRLADEGGGPMRLSVLQAETGASRSPIDTLAGGGLVRIRRIPVSRYDFPVAPASVRPPPVLTGEQSSTLREICAALDTGGYRGFLLFGITGSGKTEVYLQAIARCIEQDRQAIVLVPEISLTPQTVRRFRTRFERVAVLHSGQTESERRHWWAQARAGEVDVVIGPRSAIFAPLPKLGLVVVDEEHDTSFKQGRAPRYHARDVALVRAKAAGAVVVLGSATPALESFHNARTGKYGMLRLTARVGGGALPPVELVDMGVEMRETKRFAQFSRRLKSLVTETLAGGHQAMLFLNRRGYTTTLLCRRCGENVECDHCSVTLTYHQSRGRALCHLCGFETAVPTECPTCGQPGMLHRGFGTEKVEEEIAALFPDARVARMDSDTMSARDAYEEVLGRVTRGEVDILVGTQMIAKGLHFPGVTAVGVVDAHTTLRLPDFRASERTFQLIAQVSGRTGRSEAGGRVVVQTFRTGQPALEAASAHDYLRFATEELALRRALGYPPFGRVLLAVIQGKREKAVERRARDVAALLRASAGGEGVQVLGPAVPPLERVGGRVRRHVLVKAPGPREISRAVALLRRERAGPGRGTELTIDVDPVDLM